MNRGVILIFFQGHDHLHKVLTSCKNEYELYGVKTPQPLAVICGPLSKVTCYHAVINDKVVYTLDNLIATIDFLLKFMLVLKVQYPICSAHIWTFIQRYVYSIQKSKKNVAKKKGDELGSEIDIASKRRKLI